MSNSSKMLRDEIEHLEKEITKRKKALAALEGSVMSEDGPLPKKKLKFRVIKSDGKGGKGSGHSGFTEAILTALRSYSKPVPASSVKSELSEFGSKNINTRLYIALKRLESKGAVTKIKNVDGILWKVK
jgi:hypothetical protein